MATAFPIASVAGPERQNSNNGSLASSRPARPTSTSTRLHRDRRSLLRPVRHQAVDCEPKTGSGVHADTSEQGTGQPAWPER